MARVAPGVRNALSSGRHFMPTTGLRFANSDHLPLVVMRNIECGAGPAGKRDLAVISQASNHACANVKSGSSRSRTAMRFIAYFGRDSFLLKAREMV